MANFKELKGQEKTVYFAKVVIEYFKNDFGIIHDFLLEDSPWDNQLAFLLEVDIDEIMQYKELLLHSIITTYHNNVLVYPIQSGENRISSVDEDYVVKIKKGFDPFTIFVDDEQCYIKMIKYFMKLLSIDIKIETFNYYKNDLNILNDFYWNEYSKFGLDEDRDKEIERQQSYYYEFEDEDELEERVEEERQLVTKLENFYHELYFGFIKYINSSFRDVAEERDFLNYLLSLTYADIKLYTKDVGDLLGQEIAMMAIFEDDIDIVSSISYNSKICDILLDTVFSNYGTTDFDRRKLIKNKDIQDKFASLDKGYNYKYEYPVVMIHDFSMDDKLEEILDQMIVNCSPEEVFDILCGTMEIYNILYENGLDARYEEYFKIQLIRKILGDVYESVSYVSEDGSYPYKNIKDDLKKLPKNSNELFSYFFHNYETMMKLYTQYHKMKPYIIDKARLSAIENGDSNIINQICCFSHMHLDMLKDISNDCIKCVDYINIFLSRNIKEENVYDYFYGQPLDLDKNNIIRTMCLNVYENLKLERKMSKEKEGIISIIENNSNMVEYLKNNPNILLSIYRLLKYYNKEGLCYDEYDYMKSKIEDKNYKKIINRLNPFLKK